MTDQQMRDTLRLGMAAGIAHAVNRLLELTDKLTGETAKAEVLLVCLDLHDLANGLSTGKTSEQELLR